MEEIVNRVAKSKVEQIDLEDFYPKNPFVTVDISQWLFEGLLLKEKEFRQSLNDYDWGQHQNQFVSIICSADAIVPSWAFLLVGLHLQPFAQKVVYGTMEELKSSVWEEIICQIPLEKYKNKRVVVKGCGKKTIPLNAYVQFTNRLKTMAKAILFGEICSAVPLFKK
ncbi:MAG: hypothetical protein CSA94_01975 [Bacteroidetes bacterium]|nr:MAG: hypothetical protein CSA94_01975 [Bacteroidota bacterium]